METQTNIPNTSAYTTIAKMVLSIDDINSSTTVHAVVPYGKQTHQIIVASTKPHLAYIKSMRSDDVSFLQKVYSCLQERHVIDNPEKETILLINKINTLNMTQKVQAGKTVEELLLDWDDFPSLAGDDLERVGGVKVGDNKAWAQHHPNLLKCGDHMQSSFHQGMHNKTCHHPNMKARGKPPNTFSDSDIRNNGDSYSICLSKTMMTSIGK